jgi:hypothetical protein
MKNMKRIILLISIWVLCIHTVSAYKNPTPPGDGKSMENRSIASGCLPAASFTFLEINNVRARINTGGDMWWDLSGDPLYEIPKGSRKHSMFSASLWIGGLDVNGQLKLAALRYRQVGNDYWPGPLSTDGTASIAPETCIAYDRHFVIERKDVDDFLAWFNEPQLFPDYTIPRSIIDYPAHGNPARKEARYLAPFFDVDGDGEYNYENGDYPYYDLDNSLCPLYLPAGADRQPTMGSDPNYGPPSEYGGLLVDQVLKGDQTIWWVFNDKGNVHTETSGAPIGLEIRAQAFAFTTNDEINSMTFYSYEIINRSTYRLTETYFSQWVDPDIGYAFDDYIGCDVQRGLGYCYNGNAVDGSGLFSHYGDQPPAIGVDFFQGPYMDPDGMDNPKFNQVVIDDDTTMVQICDVSINGVNFGNGIIDDERFGMRRFVYHNNTGNTPWYMTDPDIAPEYYNFLRGIWKDGTKMLYGGNAHLNSGAYGPECDFMFPGDSDPCNWGTGGQLPNGPVYWTEEEAGNVPYDRRFMQSAGPFTLEPGAVNYITVGIPWARAATGGPFASVELLRRVDDKCQRLFDNCFRVVDGPDAPDMVIRELDRELILYLTNKPNSNNFNETYEEFDPSIVSPDSVPVSERYDSIYRFEGYQIFQVKDPTVTAVDVHDASKARLVAQCDVQNDVSRIINFYYDESLGAVIPVEEVNGENSGIVHSFRILEDKFATGDKRLINNKKYYFLALAYGFNEYEKYSQDPEAQEPGFQSLFGQQKPYLAGRKNINVYTAIPHIPAPLSGGTVIQAEYGAGPKITRIEGHGNGGNILDLTEESITRIMANNFDYTPTYENNAGPLNIKVVDPLNVKGGNFVLKFDVQGGGNAIDTAGWTLLEVDENDMIINSWTSNKTINFLNEQLILELGLSVDISQVLAPGNPDHQANGMLTSSISFADSSKRWLTGVPDIDGPGPFNWIRSGTTEDPIQPENNDHDPGSWLDPQEHFEKIVGGTWAPYRMANKGLSGPAFPTQLVMNSNKLENLYSVDVIFTADKSKWSRCPVVETGDDKILAADGVDKLGIRKAPSVNKEGQPDGDGTGMSWFPGYAINVETGERLNVMFGESSWLEGDNGNDMLFNPTSNWYNSVDFINNNEVIFGGKHFLYVFGNLKTATADLSPAYDAGVWAREKLNNTSNFNLAMRQLFQSVMWVSIPLLSGDFEAKNWNDFIALLENEVRVRIRVSRPYSQNSGNSPLYNVSAPQNDNWPLYRFSTWDLETVKGDLETAQSALALINIVPNPYYSFSLYEETQVDNLVKITNLPEKCTVTIFTVNGTLIRQFTKDDPTTIIEWDLKNNAGIPISGGMYLVHVDAPGIGERTVKWFGSLRPLDLNAF